MKASFAAIALTVLLAVPAAAQTVTPPAGPDSGAPAVTPVSGSFRQSCGADIQNLCPAAQTRKDQRQCIHQNRERISPTCGTFLAERRAQRQQMRQQMMQQPAAQGAPGGPGL